ncbi:hypothetical protein CTAYLR_005760 [Chrysophaeum taylorii]|uniref:Uncharacterized protein n=1 Tax=Chrysophaeum taylorii TaxID=2483200 RepID=A0AAD7XKU0_9STRA|nr:hypothetical protein CTAYLR_005760 [Chrysophaeum taylorii]
MNYCSCWADEIKEPPVRKKIPKKKKKPKPVVPPRFVSRAVAPRTVESPVDEAPPTPKILPFPDFDDSWPGQPQKPMFEGFRTRLRAVLCKRRAA